MMYELYISPGSCHCPDLSAAELNAGERWRGWVADTGHDQESPAIGRRDHRTAHAEQPRGRAEFVCPRGGPISSGDDLLEWVTAADGKGLGLAQKSK